MRDREREVLRALKRVQEFFASTPILDPSPGLHDMLSQLDSLIAMIEHEATDQAAGNATWRESTRLRQDLIETLRDQHMTPLREIASGMAGTIKGVNQKFRVPPTTASITELLTAARQMLQQAPAYSDAIIARGRPVNFLAQMDVKSRQFNRTPA